MKKAMFLKITLMLLTYFGVAQNNDFTIQKLEGVYNGKNLYIRNSYGKDGIGYCVTETKVNGKVTGDEINADIFQIDFSKLGIKKGDKLIIEIKCKKDCSPRNEPIILNSGAIANELSSGNEMVMVLDGIFKWQNLLFLNPRCKEGNIHGIQEIKINNKPVKVDSNSDLLEVKINNLGYKDKETLHIEIKYLKGCDPILMNAESIY